MSRAGFYKNCDGELGYGPSFIRGPEYSLTMENKDDLLQSGSLPFGGWHWFDSEEEAVAFFGMAIPTPPHINSGK